MPPQDDQSPEADDRARLEQLAHDLRNKMYAVDMGLTLLQRQSHDEATRTNLFEMLLREQEQAKQLLESLLEVALSAGD